MATRMSPLARSFVPSWEIAPSSTGFGSNSIAPEMVSGCCSVNESQPSQCSNEACSCLPGSTEDDLQHKVILKQKERVPTPLNGVENPGEKAHGLNLLQTVGSDENNGPMSVSQAMSLSTPMSPLAQEFCPSSKSTGQFSDVHIHDNPRWNEDEESISESWTVRDESMTLFGSPFDSQTGYSGEQPYGKERDGRQCHFEKLTGDTNMSQGLICTQQANKDTVVALETVKTKMMPPTCMTPFAPEFYPSNNSTIVSLSEEPKRGLSQVQPSPRESQLSSKDQIDVHNEDTYTYGNHTMLDYFLNFYGSNERPTYTVSWKKTYILYKIYLFARLYGRNTYKCVFVTQRDVSFLQENVFRITDKLLLDFSSELGRGAASNVYKGKFENIPVAVKRIKCKDKTDAGLTVKTFRNSRESKLMNILETERHNNIVGYYVSEYKHTCMYIAMELCHGTLADYVVNEDLKVTYPPVKVNQNITSGVDFLHSNNIAHRDLKPENIYFITKGTCVSKFVIGDFGTSKITVDDICSMSTSVGTSGYIAPEVWKEIISSNEINLRRTMNLSSDIFALGCVIFYTVSNGEHPYGKHVTRQYKIHQNEPPCVEKLDPWRDPIKQLVVMMLHNNPKKRPTSREVNDHPALWSAERTMNFLGEASDVLQNTDDVTKCKMEDPNVQLNGNWAANLPPKLKLYLDSRVLGRRYIYREIRNSVCGLLRTIRNVTNHYKEFPPEEQSDLGQFPEGHAELWMRVCPTLLMHVYRKVKELQIPGLCHLVSNTDSADSKKRDIVSKPNSCHRESKTNAAEGDNYRAIKDVTIDNVLSASMSETASADLDHIIYSEYNGTKIKKDQFHHLTKMRQSLAVSSLGCPDKIHQMIPDFFPGRLWQANTKTSQNSGSNSVSPSKFTSSDIKGKNETTAGTNSNYRSNSISLDDISFMKDIPPVNEFVPGKLWQHNTRHTDGGDHIHSLPAVNIIQTLTEFVPGKPWQRQTKNIDNSSFLTTNNSKGTLGSSVSLTKVKTTQPVTEFVPGKSWQRQANDSEDSSYLTTNNYKGTILSSASISVFNTNLPVTDIVPMISWQQQAKDIEDSPCLTSAFLSVVNTIPSITEFVPGTSWKRQAKTIEDLSCLAMISHTGTVVSSTSLSLVTTTSSITECVPGTSWQRKAKDIEASPCVTMSSYTCTVASSTSSSLVNTIPSITEFVPGTPWQRQAKDIEGSSCLTMSSYIGTVASLTSSSLVNNSPSITEFVPGTSWQRQAINIEDSLGLTTSSNKATIASVAPISVVSTIPSITEFVPGATWQRQARNSDDSSCIITSNCTDTKESLIDTSVCDIVELPVERQAISQKSLIASSPKHLLDQYTPWSTGETETPSF